MRPDGDEALGVERVGLRRYAYGVHIPNDQLRATDIPASSASVDELLGFGLAFDGYGEVGTDKCGEIANAQRRESLTDVRTCLFFEQRRWRFFGSFDEMTDEDVTYIRSLVEEIRRRVQRGER